MNRLEISKEQAKLLIRAEFKKTIWTVIACSAWLAWVYFVCWFMIGRATGDWSGWLFKPL